LNWKSYLLWSTLPGTLLVAALEQWLGLWGVFAAFAILIIGFVAISIFKND